ncbi:MAG TPA: type II toxin-antitoxin system ParD family antitoxin [Devosia sp.]|jgi:antitoxin ParD1/3/4
MPSSYTIGAHFEKFAKDLVASGRYASVSEVLREGLRMVEREERTRNEQLEWLKAEVQKGLDSGDAEPWDVEEIKREGRRRLAAERAKNQSDAA